MENRNGPAAAFFDLGHTVIARSSVLAYSRSFFDEGLFAPSDFARAFISHAWLSVSVRSDDRIETTRDLLANVVKGWPVSDAWSVTQRSVHELVVPWVYSEIREVIEDHIAQGRDVVFISASPDFTVVPIAQVLGATDVVSTRLESRDDVFTGRVEFFCKGEQKLLSLQDLVAQRGYIPSECFAYSDSISDSPMLEAVGHPCAVNPDRDLRRLAESNEWPIIDCASPRNILSTARARSLFAHDNSAHKSPTRNTPAHNIGTHNKLDLPASQPSEKGDSRVGFSQSAKELALRYTNSWISSTKPDAMEKMMTAIRKFK